MDELATGIELDDSGMGIEEWPAAAAGDCPDDEHAAAASASAAAPTAPRTAGPGCNRPGREDLDMNEPPQAPDPLTGTVADGFDDAP